MHHVVARGLVIDDDEAHSFCAEDVVPLVERGLGLLADEGVTVDGLPERVDGLQGR